METKNEYLIAKFEERHKAATEANGGKSPYFSVMLITGTRMEGVVTIEEPGRVYRMTSRLASPSGQPSNEFLDTWFPAEHLAMFQMMVDSKIIVPQLGADSFPAPRRRG